MPRLESVVLGGIEVFFTEELDGGGARYGQDYVEFVRAHLGARRRTFEWCSGPGFIGFSLLGHGLADTVCLADVNPVAIDACRRTIEHNALTDRVTIYLSDGLHDIPAHERWDLVVGNPPHVGHREPVPEIRRPDIIFRDPEWRLHRDFYASVGAHVEHQSDIVIQENLRFSRPETFEAMLDAGGLELVDAPVCSTPPGNTLYYYVWSRPAAISGCSSAQVGAPA
jgi:hypothetical protein